jgi:glycerol kinase
VQWLRDGLGVITAAAQSEDRAREVEDNAGVYLVPAFTGLGAPHWDADARAAIIGLTRAATAAHITRAALESVAYQTADLMTAMADDAAAPLSALRVDGRMVANDWLMQFLADITAIPIERPRVSETTAYGAACLAALGCGLLTSIAEIAGLWRKDTDFQPTMPAPERTRLIAGWHDAVARTLTTLA